MDLSRYLESMKNLPDRFSNLAFWRGVRKLKDEMVKTFKYVEEWGTLAENYITSTIKRIDNAFESKVVNITSNVSPTIYPYTVTESQVPYPRVEQCIMRFDGLSTSGITSHDIIESANLTGNFIVNGTTIMFTQPMPLMPLYNDNNSLSFLSTPVSFYKTSSNMSISNVNLTIKVRCRSIPS